VISLKTPIGRRALECRAAILVFVLLLTGSISRADTCGYKWTCTSSACGAALGAMSGTAVESGVTLEACERVREKQTYIKSEPCTCPPGEAAAGAVSTGSLTGDALNLGANLWIINNVKNPYTAVFAQKFSQGFLTALFSNTNSNSEAQRQQQLANEAVQREQQEAAERARIAEQQRIDAMFARLNSQLKLSGSAIQLALKTGGPMEDLPMKLSNSGPHNGLRLKLGDSPTNGSGIQGLPGIYVGGPVDTADGSGELKLKLGDAPAPAPATTQPIPSVGIPGLPGLNLNNVEPSQAAQLADAATALTGPERGVVEDAVLLAAQKNPAISAPSDDPFVADYQKEAQVYDGAMQQQQQALQKASEAEGHVQADKAALDYASKVVQSPDATEAQKQAFQQMQSAAHSDEDAAVAARQMFEQTDVHLSIVRDRASDALASLAPPPTNLGASTSSASPAAALGPGGHAQASPPVVVSSSVPVLSLSSKPQILAASPAGGKPHVISVSECLASYSPTGSVPALEELQKKLESTMTAIEQIAKSQNTASDLREYWSKELSDAHMDIFNNGSDALLDGVLGMGKTHLEMDKKAYQESLEASMKESQQLRWEHQATAGFGSPNAVVETKIADYTARAQALLEQRKGYEERLEGIEKVSNIFEKYKNGRDGYLFFTDNAVMPCKFGEDGKIDCDELMKHNALKKIADGDIVTDMDLFKQALKVGVKYAEPTLEFTPYGAVALGAFEFGSLAVDTTIDMIAIYNSKERLQQVKQNDVQFARARSVLGARMERLSAEVGCYHEANPTMQERGR
jgi:hypothetical protein